MKWTLNLSEKPDTKTVRGYPEWPDSLF